MSWSMVLLAFAISFNLASGAINVWYMRRWRKLNTALFACMTLAWTMRGWNVLQIVHQALNEEEAQQQTRRRPWR
jgi:hypothetical protein